MTNFEAQFERFHISPEQLEHLRELTRKPPDHLGATNHVVVETVLVEGGERRVLRKENCDAKLV